MRLAGGMYCNRASLVPSPKSPIPVIPKIKSHDLHKLLKIENLILSSLAQ